MINDVKIYYKHGTNKDGIQGIIYDPEKNNNFITDGYSFIRLNNNNIKDYNRINKIKNIYGTVTKNNIIDSIKKYYDTNSESDYNIFICNFSDIKPEDLEDFKKDKIYYIKNKDIHVNYNMIKRILKISGCKDGSIFISEKQPYMVNITCKNSNSYLLGIKTY